MIMYTRSEQSYNEIVHVQYSSQYCVYDIVELHVSSIARARSLTEGKT